MSLVESTRQLPRHAFAPGEQARAGDVWRMLQEVAIDGSTRCCDGEAAAADMSECRCPKKDTAKFLDAIGDWCKGVASCPTDDGAGADLVEVDATIAAE